MYRLTALSLFLIAAFGCKNDPAKTTAAPLPDAALPDSFYCDIKSLTNEGGRYILEVDPIQFLTGEAAVNAARQVGDAIADVYPKGDTIWSVPDDYYIVNADTLRRQVEIAPDAAVYLVDLPTASTRVGSVGELPGYEQLRGFPFFLKIQGGKAVVVRAQFVP